MAHVDVEKNDKAADALVAKQLSWSEEEEKALVKKIDYRLIPIVSVMYFLCFLDRVNIGNAKVANNDRKEDTMEYVLGLDNLQFNWAVAIFFPFYIIFEIPSNAMMKIAGPKLWLARIMVSWGILSTCHAAVNNFASLMAARAIMGACEAGLFPGVLFLFTFWYKKHEISTRVAVLFSFNSVASAFSGLLATAISYMNGVGGLKGWQWVFIIEGLPSVIVGIVAFMLLPNFPHNSKPWLSERETEVAVNRLPTTASSATEKHWDWAQFWDCLKDPMLHLFCLASFLMILPGYGQAYFRPSIIAGLGFSGNMANLMSAWPGVLTAVVDQWWGWHSDKYKERALHIQASLFFGVLGAGLLVAGQILKWEPGLRYFFLFVMAFSGPALPILFVYRTNTIKGATRLATSTAMTVAVGNIGGFLSPFTFPNSWAPLYIPAIWISLALFAAAMVVCFAIQLYEKKLMRDPEWAREMASNSEVVLGGH